MLVYIFGQPRYGSCFFHSMYAATNHKYLFSREHDKIPIVTKIRKFLSDIIDDRLIPSDFMELMINEHQSDYLNEKLPQFLKKMDDNQIKNIFSYYNKKPKSKTIHEQKKELELLISTHDLTIFLKKKIDWRNEVVKIEKERIKNICSFVDNLGILMMCCYLKRNVIFLDHDTQNIRYEEILNKNWKTIVLDYELNFHYEMYAIKTHSSSEYITEFDYNHPFLKQIKKDTGLQNTIIHYIKNPLYLSNENNNEKIFNPFTNRWVLKSGKKGNELLSMGI